MENENTQKAYEFIRERILDGVFLPGHRLQTVDLAEEVSVSRTPVREALRLLEIEGLVTIIPRVGATVRVLDKSEFRELCELRLALESLAAELAARNRAPEELLEIQDTVERMDQAVKGLERELDSPALTQELVQLDFQFHHAILRAAHNNLVRSQILRLHLVNRVARMTMDKVRAETEGDNPEVRLERQRWVLECHRKIFLAIQARNERAAREAMHEHITDLIERSMLAMARTEKKEEAMAPVRHAYD